MESIESPDPLLFCDDILKDLEDLATKNDFDDDIYSDQKEHPHQQQQHPQPPPPSVKDNSGEKESNIQEDQAIQEIQLYIYKINDLCNYIHDLKRVKPTTSKNTVDFCVYNYLQINTDIYYPFEYNGNKIIFLIKPTGSNRPNSVEVYLAFSKLQYNMMDKLAINWTVIISLLDSKNGNEAAFTMSMIIENVYTNVFYGINFCNKDKMHMFVDSNNNLLFRIYIRDNK